MSWPDLARLGITLRPFADPPPSGGVNSPFNATLGSTLEVLARELEMLDASRVVLQVGYREQDLRQDGMPRAGSRMLHDAVALSFESKWGPLRYQTNEFVARSWGSRGEGWEQNLRAIALGMEALRKVDRYGVSKRGEQYTGWRQLAEKSSAPADALSTAEDAQRFLDEHGGSFIEAAKKLHPDAGGDPELFRAAVRARELLGGAA